MASTWGKSKKIGDKGELWFRRHIGYFMHKMTYLPYEDKGKTEGRDIYAFDLSTKEKFNGNIEVKTTRYFLTRDNAKKLTGQMATQSGLNFELWSNAYDEKGIAIQDKSKWTHGWVYAMFHPQKYTAEKARSKAVEMGALAYMLYQYDPLTKKPRPYAAITFTNIEGLKERLRQLAKPFEWDLDEWNLSLDNMELWENTTQVVWNEWIIPFDDLRDLACVTMIDAILEGEQHPWSFLQTKNPGKVDPETRMQRYKMLQELAGEWRIDLVKEDKVLRKLKQEHKGKNFYAVDTSLLPEPTEEMLKIIEEMQHFTNDQKEQ